MRIAQVCHRYFPNIGGAEEHVRNISERLVKKHDVSVFTTEPSGKLPKEEVINGVEVRRFKSWAPNEAYYFSKELKRFLMKNSNEFDIVHAHNYHAFPAFYAAQAKSRNRLVFTPHYHGTGHTFLKSLLHIPYRFLGKKIFDKAHRIVCVSNYERNLVMKHFKVDGKKVVVIPNGINLEEFRGLKRGRKDYRVILYVGRLEKYKGVYHLIKALPKLDNDIVLEIVGKGLYKKSLVKVARKLGVESRVRFYHNLPKGNLLQKYADADLFVSLSKHEAFGMCVAEALASKTPCIVANTSALKEWIDDENCFGIDYPVDVGEVGRLINEVIGREIGGVKLYDWADTVRELSRIYEEIC